MSYPIPAQLCLANAPVDPAYAINVPIGASTWYGAYQSGLVILDFPPALPQVFGENLRLGTTVRISGISPSGFNTDAPVAAVGSGVASTNGHNVTWVSGNQFSLNADDTIMIGTNNYTVVASPAPTATTLTTAGSVLPTSNNMIFSQNNEPPRVFSFWLPMNPSTGSVGVSGQTVTGTGGQVAFSDIRQFDARTCYPDEYGPQPPIVSMNVAPSTIQGGQSATLSWTTNNADTVSISPGIGTVAASDSMTVSPAVTTTYTLTATNANGSQQATAMLTVSAAPPAANQPCAALTGSATLSGNAKISCAP